MRRTFFACFFAFASFSFLQAQVDDKSAIESLGSNVYHGFKESLSWYDIPMGVLFLTRDNLRPDEDDRIHTPAFFFEQSVQQNVGRSGRFTFGSIDQDYFPDIVAFGRLAFNIGQNLFNKDKVTKDDFKHTFVFQKAMLYNYTITEITKNIFSRKRPDGTDSRSFYSGHTSAVFTAATFLNKEIYGYIDSKSDKDLFLPGSTLKIASSAVLYGWAGFVGYSRIRDNKHYLSDVIIGAAAGTLIGTLTYNSFFGQDTEGLWDNFSMSYHNKTPYVNYSLNF